MCGRATTLIDLHVYHIMNAMMKQPELRAKPLGPVLGLVWRGGEESRSRAEKLALGDVPGTAITEQVRGYRYPAGGAGE
jgi:hypothetical protein